MSYGWASSFLSIVCKNENQFKEVQKEIEDNYSELFVVEQSINSNNTLNLTFQNSDIYSDSEETLESFAKWLKKRFDLKVSGHIIENMDDGYFYRTEFNDNGELISAEINWFGQFSVEQIQDLQIIAHDKFNSLTTAVELYCPKCGCKREVMANMKRLELYSTTVVANKNGRCSIDWDNADVSGDFDYCCKCCCTVLANDLNGIEEKLKIEREI